MENLGVIPARGGSKGIPRKNLIPLCGRPLLDHTCRAALESRCLTRVILDTDDHEIAEQGRKSGVEVPFLRPDNLALDDTLIADVLVHLLNRLSEASYAPDHVVLLQPTSPLRRAEHIDEAIGLMGERDADGVVSVIEVPHQFNPVSVLKLADGHLVPFLNGPTISRRQNKPVVYARNGPAILVIKTEVARAGRLYGEKTVPYFMRPEDSADIDDFDDLAYAEFIMERRNRGEAKSGTRVS